MYVSGLRENCTIDVLNMNGQVLRVFKPEGIENGRISIADQPDGMYIFTIRSGNYLLKTLRVVKK